MLTAEKAHRIAADPYSYWNTLIEDAARHQKFELELDTRLTPHMINYLENLGYGVKDISVPKYEETPYGYTNKIIGQLNRVRISW